MSTPKTITVVDKLEGKEADYTPIAKEYLQKHPSATLTAAINALNCHMADMFITMLIIVGEKYGHSPDEMIDAIKMDSRWQEAQTHPLVKSLSYFDQRDADAALTGHKTKAEIPTETLQEAVTAIKKVRAKKAATATVAEESAVQAEVASAEVTRAEATNAEATNAEATNAEVANAEAAPKPVKKTTKKAATAATAVAATTEESAEAVTKPVKKATKKAAATETAEDATAAITEKVKAMVVSEPAIVTTVAAPKKTIPKKTATK